MSDKMPSPWSEEFHTGERHKRIGGDKLEHGAIKDTYNKAKGNTNNAAGKPSNSAAKKGGKDRM